LDTAKPKTEVKIISETELKVTVKSWAKVPKDFLIVIGKVALLLGHSSQDHGTLDTIESV